MAQARCPSCGGSGYLGYDMERPQTCTGCSGRGTITVPDPMPKYTQPKPASSATSKSTKKTKTKEKSSSGTWNLFKPAPPVKKKTSNKIKSKPVKAQSKVPVLPKPATKKIKEIAGLIGVVGGVIIFGESSNIGAALLGAVVIYFLVGLSIVIINNILEFTVELVKMLAGLVFFGVIIFIIAYALQHG